MVQESIGVPVELVDGRWGQFEVEVDGTTVLSRKGGLIAKFTGRPWPSDDDVVSAVREALPAQ